MVQASEYYKSWHGTYETDGGGPFIQYNSIEISGTEGSIIANFNEISSLHVTGLQKPECGEVVGGNERLFERLAVDFIHSIDENRRPFIDGESAARTTEFICAIYDAAGQPIRTSF